MNVKELIKKLQEIQKMYDEHHAKDYDDDSPDVRLSIKTFEDSGDLENYWLDSLQLNVGSGYEEFPEVVLGDSDE